MRVNSDAAHLLSTPISQAPHQSICPASRMYPLLLLRGNKSERSVGSKQQLAQPCLAVNEGKDQQASSASSLLALIVVAVSPAGPHSAQPLLSRDKNLRVPSRTVDQHPAMHSAARGLH